MKEKHFVDLLSNRYSKEEFKFCYGALKKLWATKTKEESLIAQAELVKVRRLFKDLHERV